MRDLGDGPERPILRGISGNGLKNWQFGLADGDGRAIPENGFQQGHDRFKEVGGIRQDVRGLSKYERVADLAHYGIHFTSGAWRVAVWEGDLLLMDCEVNGPLPTNPNVSSLDGNGLGGTDQADDGLGGEHAGRVIIRNCRLQDIRGNDGMQFGMGEFFHEGDAWLIVEDTTFIDVTEGLEAFHTDSIQILGCPDVEIRRCRFYGCSNVLIASDFHNGRVLIENCLSYGGTPITVQGTDELVLWHNTFRESSFPDSTVIFYTRYSLPAPMKLTMVNNIIGGVLWRDATSMELDDESLISNNLVLTDPGGTTPSTPAGQHLEGFAELGLSDRMDLIDWPAEMANFPGADIAASFELANTPFESDGLGEGITLTGMPTHDMLGRAYATARDVGCFQSDPGTLVTPSPRAPYLLTRVPTSGATGVAASTHAGAIWYPVPGQQLDPATVTPETAWVTDPTGQTLPAVVTLGEVDAGGHQPVTIDVKSDLTPITDGNLFPLVTYTVHFDGIADTQGSEIVTVSWSFRVIGPIGPAIGAGVGGTPMTLTEFYALLPDVEPRFRYKLTSAAHQLGELMAGGLPAAQGIVLVEESRQDIRDALDLSDQQTNFESITGP
jgi:hypothetical protein